MSFTHPKDAEIKELYLSGYGYKETGKILGLGKSAVEYSCARQGIARKPVDRLAGKEDEIIALAKTGLGWKAIIRRLGIDSTSPTAIRTLLKKHGINAHWKDCRKQRMHSLAETYAWGTSDIEESNLYWRKYDRTIRKAYGKTQEEKNAEALAYYYADHEENKAKSKANALKRYHKIKTQPWWKAKQFARNQAYRVVEQVRGLRCGWGHREYLGCTYEAAAAHITAQLQDGWTWENYGIVWEIDHIRPLSDHNLLDDVELRAACHYTNLRPLLVDENRRRKRGRYTHRQAA